VRQLNAWVALFNQIRLAYLVRIDWGILASIDFDEIGHVQTVLFLWHRPNHVRTSRSSVRVGEIKETTRITWQHNWHIGCSTCRVAFVVERLDFVRIDFEGSNWCVLEQSRFTNYKPNILNYWFNFDSSLFTGCINDSRIVPEDLVISNDAIRIIGRIPNHLKKIWVQHVESGWRLFGWCLQKSSWKYYFPILGSNRIKI